MKAYKRLVPLLLALLCLLLSACAEHKGRVDEYDGFTVRTERSEKAEQERPAAPERSISDAETMEDYVLNKSSKRFHYPWCSSVPEITENNRWEYRGTRASVVEMGYIPCKKCSP